MNFFWEILWIFFQRIYSWKISVNLLWNLTLEKFSIFYQSLRDYNCGSNRCMVTCRVSKRISWTRRTFWEIFFVADFISGHFMKIWILVIFSIFFHHFQQMLIVGSPKWGWVFWGPKLVILNVWVQFSLYLNHFVQLEANISWKRLGRLKPKKAPNCKNRVDPREEEERKTKINWLQITK